MVLFSLLGCASLLYREKWTWSCYLCECVFEKKGKDIVIPFTRANPIEVFQRIEIEGYPFATWSL